MEVLNISGRLIGPGHLPFFIAEIGSNHNGDMDLCRRLVDTAVASGADAVKFQSWSKDSLICGPEYERNTDYTDKHKHFGTLEEMCSRYQFTREQHFETADYCNKKGVIFLSTPFSVQEADLLEELGVPCFKVASMDVNHLPFLKYLATKGKPIILSTGMATLGEIERAVQTLRVNGSGPIALLHCIAVYPPAYEEVHLNNIPMLRQCFALPVGFSDHSLGAALSLAAVALGACIIEKHFTLDKEMEGWDHAISAEPGEFEAITCEGKKIFTALGGFTRVVSPAELAKRRTFRRRIVAGKALAKGKMLTPEDLAFKRPGTGIGPDELDYVVGRTLKRSLAADEELEWGDLS